MKKLFVIGRKLPHTLSPQIFEMFGKSGYGKIELEPNELGDFLRAKAFDGINVTVPYKQDVINYLDYVDDTAKEINAVNTIVNKGGKLFGYNTDAGGIEYALSRAGIELEGKHVLVLGTGGTSKTACYVAKKMGAKCVKIAGRTSEINYQNIYNEHPEVVINTTPVGMYPNCDEAVVDVTRFDGLEGVFDVIYNPLQTKIVCDAKKIGVRTSCGLSMLVEQARLAKDKFFDEKSDATLTESVLTAINKDRKNIVLIGMPSSGKSTVGKMLASLMGRKFVDLDEKIEQREGVSIPEIFKQKGEAYFRQIEAEECVKYAYEMGVVIATGGGTVCNEKSLFALKQNGLIVWIKRDDSSLSCEGRPVSQREGIASLKAKREPIYNEASDVQVDNVDPERTAKEIAKYYEENTCY